MSRAPSSRISRVAIFVVVVLLVASPLIGAAVAQDGTTTPPEGSGAAEDGAAEDETTSAPEDSDEDDDETSSIVSEVDEQVRVSSYTYNEEAAEFSITFDHIGETSSTLTITEVIDQRAAGSGSFGVEVVTIQPGETAEVTVSAEKVRGTAGVMIVSERSLERGEGTYLQEGGWGPILGGDATWTDVRAGIVFATLVSILAFIVAAWYVVAERHERISEVDLNA